MTVTTSRSGSELFIKVDGRVDPVTSRTLEEELDKVLTDEVRQLTMELSGCEYISSSGLRVLIFLFKKMNGNGRRLIFKNPGEFVTEVLEISGLMRYFTIEYD